MRALMFPTYSFPGKVLADSLYILARSVIRQVTDVHWYLIVPDWSGKFPEDDLDDLPHVTKIPTPMKTLYRAQESVTDPDTIWKFSPADGTLPVEFAISHTPQRSLNLMNAWSIRAAVHDRPVVATWDLLARDDRGKEYNADEIELVHNAAGMAISDLNMHEAPVTEWMAGYNARKYLSPAYVRRVLDSSRLYELGIDWGRLAAANSRKREKFTVYYGGRFAQSKRFDDLAEVVDDAYRFGRDMEFVVCTGSLNGIKDGAFRARFPQVELHVGTNQEEAWAIQQTCHASICFSRGEIFGMSFWEQLGGGLATVFKTEHWNEKMLPAEYPLWASSRQEIAILLRKLYDEFGDDPIAYDEKYGWDSRWPSYVRERYDPQNLVRMVDEIREVALGRRRKAFDGMGRSGAGLAGLIDDATEGVDEIGWEDLVFEVRGRSRIGKNVIGKKLEFPRSNSMLDLYRGMLYRGWSDDVASPVPVFRRPGG